MRQRSWIVLATALLAAAIPMVACGGDSLAPASPSPSAGLPLDANPDGSTLKATAPTLLSPIEGVRLDDQTPVFQFSPAQARHVDVPLAHEIQLLTDAGGLITALSIGAGATTREYPGVLDIDTPYRWRVRAVHQGAVGPWSSSGQFVTVDRPILDPSNMFPFILEFAQTSHQWGGCVNGDGVACHRFVQDVVRAANPNCDPRGWGLLSKNPGEWQCTRVGCGGLGGEGFGEDIIVWGGPPLQMYDIILGAGALGATLAWQDISGTRRPGNNWACPW